MKKGNRSRLIFSSMAIASLVACGGGSSGSGAANDTSANKQILFLDDGVNGTEPWITDGTAEGTSLLKDINSAGSGASSSENPVFKLGNKWIFVASNGSGKSGKNGYQLWVSDGTEEGTKALTNAPGNVVISNANSVKTYKNKLYLSMNVPSTDGEGYELWSTDGTPEGTTMVKDICDGTCSAYPNYMTEYKGKLYFQAYTQTNGSELWVSDGTESGTTLFKDFAPRRSIGGAIYRGNGLPRDLTVFDGKLFFSANDNSTADLNSQMWITDGTDTGTKIFDGILPPNSQFAPRPKNLFADASKMYFWANRDTSSSQFLYTTDGTAAGTNQLKDSDGTAISSNGDINYIPTASGLIFTNYDLWKLDTSSDQPKKIAPNINDVSNVVVLDNTLYMVAKNSTVGKEVFYLPLTADANTNATAIDINKNAVPSLIFTSTGFSGDRVAASIETRSSNPKRLFVLDNKLYVIANDGVHGYELWEIDPATKQASLLKDVNSTADGASSFKEALK